MTAKRKKTGWLWLAPAALIALAVPACSLQPSAGPLTLTRAADRTPWRFGDVRGVTLSTRHYCIHTTTTNESLLRHLPGFMENAHANCSALTGLSSPDTGRPMVVYMLGDRRQWAEMTRRITGHRSKLYLSIENGGYTDGGICVFWDMRNFATYVLAAHEGMHQFLYHRLEQNLPAWAEEGLAVSAEGFVMDARSVYFDPERNSLRQARLRNLISQGRWVRLDRLLPSDAGDHISAGGDEGALGYYGQLWALMCYIRSVPRYRRGLHRMIADAADGAFRSALHVPDKMGTGREYSRAVAIPAFRHYIEDDLDSFEKGFRAYARKLARLP